MKIKKFYMAVLAAAVLAGCSNDEVVPNAPDLANTPILVNAGVNNLVTRAGYGTGELKEGSFGLYLATGGTATSEIRYNCENKKVSYDANGSGWNYEGSPLYWKNRDAQVSYYAYMPYQETAPTTLSVSTVQDEETFKNEDFLYAATATASASAGGINVTFSHKLSKLDITLTRGTELEEGVTFQSVVVENCATSADIDVSTGEVTPATSGTTSSITALLSGADAYECLLVPQTMNSLAVTITATVGSETKTYKYTSSVEQAFGSGIRYTLPLTVGRDRVEVGTITAQPWGPDQSAGDLETE